MPEDLSPEEVKKLKKLLEIEERLARVAEHDERMEWLWAAIRRTASTITIIIGAIILFYDQLKNLVRGLVQ